MVDFNYNDANSFASSLGLHAVPLNICEDMISLLEKEGFFRKPRQYEAIDVYVDHHRVLDIYCNSGSLLYICYLKFMNALDERIEDENVRSEFILQYLLFGFAKDYNLVIRLRQIFYKDMTVLGNFYHYDATKQSGIDKEDAKELLNKVKFDVVLGNPPYNDDIYLDFVMLGHRLARLYDLWITPAKFINKQSDKNDEIRDKICRYISDIVYYPEHKDIFDIMLRGGIAYYLVGKSVITECNITNKSLTCKEFNSNYKRHIKDCLLNIGYDLDNKLSCYPKLDSSLNLNKRQYLNEYANGHSNFSSNDIAIVQGGKGIIGYIDKSELKTVENLDKYKIVFPSMCGAAEIDSNGKILGLNEVYVLDPNQVTKGGYPTARFFNTKFEAENFRRFMFTKFFRFLYYYRVSSSNINSTFFSSIPDPGSFNKIYEDKPLEGYTPDADGCYTDKDGVVHCSLYVKYKLTQQEIDVIESVIRERK